MAATTSSSGAWGGLDLCCDEGDGQVTQTELAEACDAGDAPLASCCAREIEERREAGRVLGILRKADVTTAGMQERGKVAQALPPSTSAVGASVANGGDDHDDLDDDDDDELEHFRRQRLSELKRRAAAATSSAGSVRTLDGPGLEALLAQHARQRWAPQAAIESLVVHFSLVGDAFCEELDEALDRAAAAAAAAAATDDDDGSNGSNACTFARVRKTRGAVVNDAERVPHAALCLFNGGEAHAVIFADEMGASDGQPDLRVAGAWLRRCGVSRAAARAMADGPLGVGSASDSDSEGEGEGGALGAPCHRCGRRYPHEHVDAVRPEFASGDARDDSGSEDLGEGW